MLINLHSHLEGRVRPATAAELAQRAGVPEPAGGWEQAIQLDGPADLTVYLEKVASTYPLFTDLDAVGRICAEAVEDAAAEGFDFLELRRPHGKEEMKARDLFFALWIPDLFMKRVKENGKWSLMCPNECPGLADTYAEEFEALYLKYEAEGKFRKQINAQELWFHILDSQTETGTPYMLYKDHVNRKSNQKNLGVIRSSNL